MSLNKGLVKELRDDSAVAALVSGRVWWEFAKQADDLPYITCRRVTMQSGLLLEGVDTLRRIWYQVDCYANGLSEVDELKTAVRGLLDGNSGTLGDVKIEFCYLDNENDLSELEGDSAVRRVSLQFIVMAHEE